MYSRLLLAGFVVLALPVCASASYDCTNPGMCTVTCTGANDHITINSAVAAVTSGGVISVAAGSCAIAGTVTISKPLTLVGAGPTLTTFAGTASPMVIVQHGATGFARVTGIAFTSDVNIQVRLSGSMTQVRVDHNRFATGNYSVFAVGRVEGVIDHNTFTNCDQCVMTVGSNTTAWTVDYNAGTGNFVAGSSHMLFIEDNQFVRDGSFSKAGSEVHYSQEGARTVFRYNTVDMSLWTPSRTYVYNVHGNQAYYDEGPLGIRGIPINEVYGNTFTLDTMYAVLEVRSGSNLFWNNTITAVHPLAATHVVDLWEEEALTGTGNHFTGKYDYVWPTEDMVTNTFIWGNTYNGAALTTSNVGGNSIYDCCGTYPDASKVINFNRDVWMHAPEASGGRTYYNGRPGASGRDADGTLVFTPSGANAYYPYTPYTYPHPLTKPAPPNDVRVTR